MYKKKSVNPMKPFVAFPDPNANAYPHAHHTTNPAAAFNTFYNNIKDREALIDFKHDSRSYLQ